MNTIPAAPDSFCLYDLTVLHGCDLNDIMCRRRIWDECHLVAALQGLVNRTGPRLFLRLNAEVDDFWFARMTEAGGWMDGAVVQRMDTLDALLDLHRAYFAGFILHDERVPATSNLASTIAGIEGLLPLRHDTAEGSLCQRLRRSFPPELFDARLIGTADAPLFTGTGTIPGTSLPSTGSAKNDAMRWLVEMYIRTGRVNCRRVGYYIDSFWLQCGQVGWPVNHTLTNHDFIIANRGPFFDLNVWDDETPVDDPGQKDGEDARTFREFFRAAYDSIGGKGMIHVAGYVPWRYKYSDCDTDGRWHAGSRHGAVESEWKCTEILTCFNAYLDADALEYASMANASFYMHYPLPGRIPQRPVYTEEELRERGYLDAQGRVVPRNYYAHYVGDYDAAAWVYWNVPQYWQDPDRGKVPLSWAFNPNLADRMGFGMHWLRQHPGESDTFVCGDSGAGYVNARNLSPPRPHSGLPEAMHDWEVHCTTYMRQWDLDVVGFVLDGNLENFTDAGWEAYCRFSPGGMVFHRIDTPRGTRNGVPYLKMDSDLPREEAWKAAEQIRSRLVHDGKPQFHCFRSVLMPPSWYLQIERELDARGRGDAAVVDMRTLLQLLRIDESSKAAST